MAGPDEATPPRPPAEDKGKQPAVYSESEEGSDDERVGGDSNAPPTTTTDVPAASGGKKKRSKKKKSKTASATAGAESELKKTLANLPPEQVGELLKLNPAISQEITAQSGGSGSAAVASSSSAGLSRSSEPKISAEAALAALKQLSLADIMTGMATSGKNAKDMASYKFWKTQPVPKFGEDEKPGGKKVEEGPIQTLTVEEVPKDPPPLVDGFEWDTIDLTDDTQVQEVFELLSGHFVEDGEAMFRFRYSKSILKW